jgi:hypothetical protein
MSLLAAELLVDDLKYFDFPEFTPAFFANLKAEVPKLLEHARKPFYWGGGRAWGRRVRRCSRARAQVQSRSCCSQGCLFVVVVVVVLGAC